MENTRTEGTREEVVTDEMIDDLLSAAFEGGSNYWAACTCVVGDWPKGAEFGSEVVTRGGNLAVREAADGIWHPITREAMESGIRQAADLWGKTVAELYEDHDADAADVALQLAIFGEVIYG